MQGAGQDNNTEPEEGMIQVVIWFSETQGDQTETATEQRSETPNCPQKDINDKKFFGFLC